MESGIPKLLILSAMLLGSAGPTAGAATPTATPAESVAATTEPAGNEAWRPITVKMTMAPTALDMAGCGATGASLFLSGMKLTDVKPATIVKEPAYQSKPYYGVFRVGNGPKNLTYLAVDQDPNGEEKIYIDVNQNGDLTDDGAGDWDKFQWSTRKEKVYDRLVALHASWGTTTLETESASYSFYLSKVRGEPKFGFYKTTTREGTLDVDGKSYPIMLSETQMDALFTVPATLDTTRGGVVFFIDLDGDHTFKGVQTSIDGKPTTTPEQYAIANPVKIGDRWFFVRPNISGSELKFIPCAAPDSQQQSAAIADPFDSRTIVKNGSIAPDFTAQTPDGKPVKLSDFKGKVVLLDFWATWCVPCQQSMPPLEKVYQHIKDQGVVVLSVNVLDEKQPFDAWIAKHSGTDYHFTFAFDPAGNEDDGHKGIATKTYGVIAIPTMFVIDRDGKVFAGLEGAGDTDRLKIALRGLGIKTD